MTARGSERVEGRGRRATPLSAHGTPGVWVLAFMLASALVMIVLLVGVIVARGAVTFWPRPIDLVTLGSGERFYGMPQRTEAYTPGTALDPTRTIDGAFGDGGRPRRRLYRVGNRDLGRDAFRWVDLPDVASIERPPEAVVLERREWGLFVGRPVRLFVDGEPQGEGLTEVGFREAVAEASDRIDRIEALRRGELSRLDRRLESLRMRVRRAELRAMRFAGEPERSPAVAWGLWLGFMALVPVCAGVAKRAQRWRRGAGLVAPALWCVCGLAGVGAAVEHPWARSSPTPAQLDALRADVGAERAELQARYERLLAEIDLKRAEDERFTVEIQDAEGRLAPRSVGAVDEPMLVSQITRVVAPNDTAWSERAGVYLSRWASFLTERPRASNTEGGIWPVIFGTVVLTLLLAVVVAPLGVIAAIYLREYARQGPVTSLIRISVNNLAGVPSIVYGVFGLGFFCYTLGGYVDTGPDEPLPRLPWWFLLSGVAVVVWAAVGLGVAARPRVDRDGAQGFVSARWVAGVAWVAAVGLLVVAAATTPYFFGFFGARASEGAPTFGTRGILWASLTLALLTLPVVIVSTEEAISAVPRSMREGSFGCGASRWQTIRRIVLPGAGPGILTGMILAMARGAGEVAPLMLVGAVKLAPELPVTGEWPFIHGERSFMHLGFHIYDLGFQSPDAQAAEGLVWSATLVLVLIVFALNLSAFVLRGRLRSRLRTSAV